MGIVSQLKQYFLSTPPEAAKPFDEQGVSGTAIFGGRVQSNETNWRLLGDERWRTAADILSNISIAAAGVRYYLNLCANPKWIVEPPSDTQEAKDAAEFVESVLHGAETSWSRVVRRSGMYKFHGFGIQEWIAKKRDDGRIGLANVEPRPCHTIEQWDIDPAGLVLGVVQRGPQTGSNHYLPRGKLVYLVDDSLTDSPEGLGWYRQMAQPISVLKEYMRLEGLGFGRDLAGIPIGRAPVAAINAAVKAGTMREADARRLIGGLRDFINTKAKDSSTGLIIDSAPYRTKTADGESISAAHQWGVELLSSQAGSIAELGEAIRRITFDIALIMGTESLLTGREGAGSLALSEDKSRNLYLNINSTLTDMAEAYDRDIIGPIWSMNGMADELRPRLKVEDAAFKDVEQIARTLRDMATAGAIMGPDDPAIDDLRDLMGISRQPEMTPERMGLLMPQFGADNPNDSNVPDPDNEGGDVGAKKAAPRTMYVQRKLLNAGDLIKWAKAQGFETTTPAGDMHVTVAFSRRPVDWMDMGESWKAELEVMEGGPRVVERLGNKGAVVLLFRSDELEWRHLSMRDKGASFDFPSYQPHVTITYDGAGVDLANIEPYQGKLKFGPEIFEEIDDDWADRRTEN